MQDTNADTSLTPTHSCIVQLW